MIIIKIGSVERVFHDDALNTATQQAAAFLNKLVEKEMVI